MKDKLLWYVLFCITGIAHLTINQQWNIIASIFRKLLYLIQSKIVRFPNETNADNVFCVSVSGSWQKQGDVHGASNAK